MRRILAFLMAACLLPLPVRAAQAKYVALTFDDGPSGIFTRSLLDGLYDRGVKGTFLLCGYRMKTYPELTRRIHDEGHEIGIHGYSHKSMERMSRRDIARELMDTQALLPEGCRPRFFRPPGGCCSDGLRQVAEARNLCILGWSVDPRDWATNDKKSIERAVLNNIHDGDIVLLHDMSSSSVDAALAIVDVLIRKGYQIVTVSELVKLRNAHLQPGQMYKKFPASSRQGGESGAPALSKTQCTNGYHGYEVGQ